MNACAEWGLNPRTFVSRPKRDPLDHSGIRTELIK